MASDLSESHTDAISELEKTEREFEPEVEEAVDDSPVKQTRFFNISIILERYGDIFSDFDPRPFSVREISDDFMDELKKRITGHSHRKANELHLLMPENKRNREIEQVIIRRLKTYLQKQHKRRKRKLFVLRRRGFFWICLGVLLLSASVIIETFRPQSCAEDPSALSAGAWVLIILNVLVTPAGWFFFWGGFATFFEQARVLERQLRESKALSKIRFSFRSYQKS